MTTPIQTEPERNTTLAKFWLAMGAIGLAAVVAFIALGGTSGDRAATEASGDPAPAVTLNYIDGTQGQLSDLIGKPVLVNFFADWCPACVAEMPDLEIIHNEFGSDVTFIGLDQSTSDSGLQDLLESTGITYDVALDRDGQIFAAFGGLGMPTTVFLYPDGTVAKVQSGVSFESELRDTLNDLFFTE